MKNIKQLNNETISFLYIKKTNIYVGCKTKILTTDLNIQKKFKEFLLFLGC